MLYFLNDYSEGAHEKVLQHLIDTNMEQLPGYGTDHYCEEAKEKIKKACGCEDAEAFLLTGGTQTNQIVIDTMLQPYEGVVAAQTGHVSTHEAGAIEFTGHKVLTLPEKNGKINAADLKNLVETFYGDENHEHMVFPGMVYISHPTEYGTLYTKKELTELSAVCREYKIPLFMDGARLIYGLVSKETDVTLQDIAKLCDVSKTIVDNCDQTICYCSVRCCNIIERHLGQYSEKQRTKNKCDCRIHFYFCTEKNYKSDRNDQADD